MEYYITNGGNDAEPVPNEGTPWATIGRLNTLMATPTGLVAGDIVKLERGSVWYEELTIPTQNDGSSGNPIVFETYGTGALPIISGFKNLSSWTSLGSGLYEIVDAELPTYINMLQINGANRRKSNGPFRIITSNGTTTTLISTNLPDYDYTGGEVEVLVEKVKWVHDKCYVTSRSGSTLNITAPSTYPTKEGSRFIVQNAIEALVEDGDWMYSPSAKKITIYSPSENPNSRNIRVSSLTYNVNATGNQWNEFRNIEFQGSNIESFRADASRYIKVIGCGFKNIGGDGLGLWTTQDAEIRDCQFINIYSTGFQQRNNSARLTFEDNYFEDIHPFFASGLSGDAKGFGCYGGDSGSTFRYNKFRNIGYVALRFGGSNVLAEYNDVVGFCTQKHDGGGIYHYGGAAGGPVQENRIVRNNYVEAYTNQNPNDSTVGYYCDDNNYDTLYQNNVAVNCPDSNWYNHNSQNIRFQTGKAINSPGKLYIHNAPNALIRDVNYTNNVNVYTSKQQWPYRITSTLAASDIGLYGTNNNNRHIFLNNDFVVKTHGTVSGKRILKNYTLAEWRSIFEYDVDSVIKNLEVPEYTNYTEGAERFQGDGTFESSSTAFTSIFYSGGTATRTIDSTGAIDPILNKSLKIEATSESATTTRIELSFTGLGNLEEGKVYVVRFKARASGGTQSLNCYFNTFTPLFKRITQEWGFVANDEVKEFELFVDRFTPGESVVFYIDSQSSEDPLYIKDFRMRELLTYTKTNVDDHVRLITNLEKTTENIALPTGTWKDVDDNILTSPVSLESFESKIILSFGDPMPIPYGIFHVMHPLVNPRRQKLIAAQNFENGEVVGKAYHTFTHSQFHKFYIGSETISSDYSWSIINGGNAFAINSTSGEITIANISNFTNTTIVTVRCDFNSYFETQEIEIIYVPTADAIYLDGSIDPDNPPVQTGSRTQPYIRARSVAAASRIGKTFFYKSGTETDLEYLDTFENNVSDPFTQFARWGTGARPKILLNRKDGTEGNTTAQRFMDFGHRTDMARRGYNVRIVEIDWQHNCINTAYPFQLQAYSLNFEMYNVTFTGTTNSNGFVWCVGISSSLGAEAIPYDIANPDRIFSNVEFYDYRDQLGDGCRAIKFERGGNFVENIKATTTHTGNLSAAWSAVDMPGTYFEFGYMDNSAGINTRGPNIRTAFQTYKNCYIKGPNEGLAISNNDNGGWKANGFAVDGTSGFEHCIVENSSTSGVAFFNTENTGLPVPSETVKLHRIITIGCSAGVRFQNGCRNIDVTSSIFLRSTANGVRQSTTPGTGCRIINCISLDSTGSDVLISTGSISAINSIFETETGTVNKTTCSTNVSSFVDFAADDFRLAEGSPLIGAGTYTIAGLKDLTSRDFLNPPSIGAFEYIEEEEPPAVLTVKGLKFILHFI